MPSAAMPSRPSRPSAASQWRRDLASDLDRYRVATYLPRLWWLTEKTVWAIAVFRAGQGIRAQRNPLVQGVLRALFWPVAMATHLLTSVELWPETKVGPGLRIYHGVGLIVNPLAVIGSNVVLCQGVTIGSRHSGKRVAPTIGDDVVIGAHAVVVGDIHVGNGVRIGANAVVVENVPDGATVVGPRARIIERPAAATGSDPVDSPEDPEPAQ